MIVYQSFSQIRKDLLSGNSDLSSIVGAYLNKIQQNSHLNAFNEVFAAESLERAIDIQKKIAEGQSGKLAGMVLGLKDNICYKGHICSASSDSLRNFVAPYTATAVERLLKEDVIIIGRTNCDEFAMGGTNETSAFGKVLNPLNLNCVPGGSSGGSAAAVAAGLCTAAIGSDTGGSIRQPASFCGLTGLKPTYGRVSRYGLIAYGSSFDQIGPIARTIEDVALILEVISGFDENDSTSSRENVPEYSKIINNPVKPANIAYLEETLQHPGLDPEIRDTMNQIFNRLRTGSFMVEPVGFPYLDYLVPAYYVMAMAEASSNLARYDGIHYSYRSPEAKDIESTYTLSRSESFGFEVKRRIMAGSFVLSTGYYDAYYAKAQKARQLIFNKITDILNKFDFILLPTTPRTAFGIGTMGDDPVALYLEDIYTILANLTGIPAISIPLGRHSNGLPFGIQVLTSAFREAELLAFGNHLLKSLLT